MPDPRAAVDPAGTSPAARGPLWPTRLIAIGRELRRRPAARADSRLISEMWLLLATAVRQRLRAESRRVGPIGREDAEDLAAEKSLGIARKIDEGTWDLAGSSPAEVMRFISTIARNGLVDHLRRASRSPLVPESTATADHATPLPSVEHSLPADSAAIRRDFVEALLRCAGRLSSEHRRIWFLRVFHEMPSRRIAAHPRVQRTVGSVDVIQQRTRGLIRDCMETHGFDPREIPPGTFAALWQAIRWEERDA